MIEKSDRSSILEILAEASALTLSTIDPDGSPRGTPLFFASDDSLRLYFLSDADSRHSRNLAREPRAAISLYPPVQGWQDIRGLQMKGGAALLDGHRRTDAMAIYQEKFPFIRELESVVEASSLYRFSPTWIRLIDNRKGFGFRQEWTFQ